MPPRSQSILRNARPSGRIGKMSRALFWACAAVMVVMIGGVAGAQVCQPEWLPGFGGLPGTDCCVQATTEWDSDGPGPQKLLLVAGGSFTTAGAVAANRVGAWDGFQWQALGAGVSGTVNALTTWEDDGEAPHDPVLVAAGVFETAGGVTVNNIAAWNGLSWTPMQTGLTGSIQMVYALVTWDPDGAGPQQALLISGGQFTQAGNVPVNRIAAWNGASWQALGAGMDHWVRALTTWDPDGAGPEQALLIAGGSFVQAEGMTVNRISAWNASSWQALGSGMNDVVYALASWDPDGGGPQNPLLIAGGSFTDAGGTTANHIAAWNGAAWQALATGTDLTVSSLAPWDPDGEGPQPSSLIASGEFTSAGGAAASYIAAWNGSWWQALSTGTDSPISSVTPWDFDGPGPQPSRLVAGGAFSVAGGVPASRVAAWDGMLWESLGDGTNIQPIRSTVWDMDGPGPQPPRLIAGGGFTSVQGVAANRIAAWDGTSWQAFGGGTSGTVQGIAPWDPDGAGSGTDALIVGGLFTSAGGVAANNIASWNGVAWQPLGTGTSGQILWLTTWDSDASGPVSSLLIAAGLFTTAGAVTANNIAGWDGASWQAFGTGTNGLVRGVTAWDPDGAGPQNALLVAGGAFTSVDGMLAQRLAAWNGASWETLGTGVDNTVQCITTWDPDRAGPQNALLIAGGFFANAGGVSANRIAAWNGSAWQPFGTGLAGTSSRVSCFAEWDPDGVGPQNTLLVAGGVFTSAGGGAAGNIAGWDGAAWQALGTGTNNEVRALSAWDPDDSGPGLPRLFTCGSFTQAGGLVSAFMSEYGRASSTWLAPTGGVYNDPLRWLCGVEPSRFDRIVFDATESGYTPSAFTVTLPDGAPTEPVRAEAMRVRTDTVTLNLRSRPFILNEDQGLSDPSLIVGDIPDQPATLLVRNTLATPVAFEAGSVLIAEAPTASLRLSQLRVQDPSAEALIAGDLYVGRRGNKGELVVQGGGGAVVEGLVSVGTVPGAVGEIRVINSGSTLFHGPTGTSLGVGDRGSGTLRIGGTGLQAGAAVATIDRMDTITVGLLPGASGTVLISGAGSSWTVRAHRVFFGYAAPTSVIVEGGALLDTDTFGEVVIGQYPAAAAVVEVRGSGSRWIERSQAITVGEGARLVVGAGATVEALGVNILAGGMLTGSGTVGSFGLRDGGRILTDLNNAGEIDPTLIDANTGAPLPGTATLTVLGNFRQSGLATSGAPERSGSLRLTVTGSPGSPQTDALAVSEEATLGGGLIVERDPALSGVISQALLLLSADSGVVGFFDVAFLPPAGEPGKFLRAEAAAGLSAVGEALRGPFNTTVVLTSQDLAALINTTSGSTDTLPGEPTAAVVADFDGVNGVDVAVVIPDATNPTANPGELFILLNQGVSGSWQGWATAQYTDAVGRNPRGIAAGQIDGQPGPDLVVADAGDDTVSVLVNSGSGVFLPRTTFAVGAEPRAVAAADLDGDGFADVATANTTGGTISLLRNQGVSGPTWQGLGQSLGDQRVDVNADATSLAPRPVDLIAVPLNAEAGAEIAAANEGASSVTIFGNSASLRTWYARWSLPPVRVPTSSPPTAIEPEDLDEDKWDDIIVASESAGTVGVVLNDRQASDPAELLTFRPIVEVPAGASPSSLAGADLDGDGDRDLAVATTDDSAQRVVRVLRNDLPVDGTVTLSPDQDVAAGTDPRIVLSGNVDADAQNRDDLIVLNASGMLLRGGVARGPLPAESRVLLGSPPPPPPCPGDADGNRVVNFGDITSVLTNWGRTGPPYRPGDADGSGAVTFADITAVLTAWGTAC